MGWPLCPCSVVRPATHCSLSCLVPFAGKVHGSLARAGKVRGQAPKVRGLGWAEQQQGSIVTEDALMTLARLHHLRAGTQAG
eukprot:1099100-Pelagomonas_calceolata.AAC.1